VGGYKMVVEVCKSGGMMEVVGLVLNIEIEVRKT
jgi:hypothetical protein